MKHEALYQLIDELRDLYVMEQMQLDSLDKLIKLEPNPALISAKDIQEKIIETIRNTLERYEKEKPV